MNGTTLERPDVAAYLDAVRARLADLPLEERDDLVADVEASLLEAGEPPTLSPEEFAAELREAAGLAPETSTLADPSPFASLRSWLSPERVASWRSTARELAPIWWLTRAYVAVVLLAVASNQGWPIGAGRQYSEVSFATSILALLIAGAISIWLGLRGRRDPSSRPRLSLVVNVALALATLPVAGYSLAQLDNGGRYVQTFVYTEPVTGLANNGIPLRNLYPYTRDGKLLFDVLLFDDDGQPLNLISGPEDISRRVLSDKNGTPIFNSFPIRYFDPGTRSVSNPELGPPVTVPEIATPPPLEQPKPKG
jgi:hypothetical protein